MRGVARAVTDAGRSVHLLRGIDLELPLGGVLHVAGPSGAGKSSLIRLINRLDEATAGALEARLEECRGRHNRAHARLPTHR